MAAMAELCGHARVAYGKDVNPANVLYYLPRTKRTPRWGMQRKGLAGILGIGALLFLQGAALAQSVPQGKTPQD